MYRCATSTHPSDDALNRMLLQGAVEYAIYMIDPDGIVLTWNAGAERVKGYGAEEVIGRNFAVFYSANDQAAAIPDANVAAARSTGRYSGSGWRVRRDGSMFWAQVTLAAVFDDEGGLVGYAKTTRDQTENQRQLETIRQVSARLDLAMASMSQGLALFDAQQRICLWNARWSQLTKHSARHGDNYQELLRQGFISEGSKPAQAMARSLGEFDRHCSRMREAAGETVVEERKSGDRVLVYSHRATSDGGFVSTVDDVTERRLLEEQAVYLEKHDALTGLPNRAMVGWGSTVPGDRCGQPGGSAILCIELDRFKGIIDAYGHAAADVVLRTVADRIRTDLRKNDEAIRLGGDEFVVVASKCLDGDEARGLASRLIKSIQLPIPLNNASIFVKASVGIVLHPGADSDFATLLGLARLALHAQHQTGTTGLSFYDPGMVSTKRDREILEQELHDALSKEEFELRFQPIVSAKTHDLVGFEALLRWTSPSQGPLSPAVFVPIGEEIGLAYEIDEWVLHAACRDAMSWSPHLVVSVNLSAAQLRKRGLAARIAATLERTGLPARRLEVEITETTYIQDLAFARTVVSEVRALGVQIALDDFGTGYSSLSLLLALSFTRVKIDRSFVQDLATNKQSAAVVNAICGLCEKLGVESTAEGVEGIDEARWLLANGCTHLQGYLFGQPLTASSAQAFMAGIRDRGTASITIDRVPTR